MAERKMIYLDDAINALERKKDKKAMGDIGGFYNKIIQNDIDALKQLPLAQPKRGKWIIKDNPRTGWYRVTCSECGEDITSTAPCIGFYPNAKVYCPNCGAEMREGEEE